LTRTWFRRALKLAFAIGIPILCTGCGTIEFDATPEGFGQAIHVGNDQDVEITLQPLTYRMRADEGHLIVWIENQSNGGVELVGDKSNVIDPQGQSHPLRDQMILVGESCKLILPPLDEGAPGAEENGAAGVNPYDRPGFIAIPDQPISEETRDVSWQWDDNLEIQLNLVFQRGESQFDQHFSIQRIRK
jgi:hypothetical protein